MSSSSIPISAPAHFALVDSGASIHILLCHTFLTNAESNHSAVASFSGSTSRATHKGTFTALMRCTRNKYHTYVQLESTLVVPDASRILFSISQALTAGHHVHFGTNPGLLLHGSTQFIPFVKDVQSGMFLLPLYPPLTRHNGTYPLTHHVGAEAEQILPAIPIYTPPAAVTHNTLGHVSNRRTKQLDVGLPMPSGAEITCPICITAKRRRASRPLPSDVAQRAQHPWQDVYVDLSGKMRTQGIGNVYYFIPFVCSYSGARIVEFVERKNHFIHAYRRFVARINSTHPRKLPCPGRSSRSQPAHFALASLGLPPHPKHPNLLYAITPTTPTARSAIA